jgi:hypothetical protein
VKKRQTMVGKFSVRSIGRISDLIGKSLQDSYRRDTKYNDMVAVAPMHRVDGRSSHAVPAPNGSPRRFDLWVGVLLYEKVHILFNNSVDVDGLPVLGEDEHDIVRVTWIPTTGVGCVKSGR